MMRRREVATENRDHVKQDHETAHRHDAAEESRQHQVVVGVNAHGFQRPNLTQHGIGGKLGGDGRAAPSHDGDGSQQRTELSDDRHHHQLSDQLGGSNLVQLRQGRGDGEVAEHS